MTDSMYGRSLVLQAFLKSPPLPIWSMYHSHSDDTWFTYPKHSSINFFTPTLSSMSFFLLILSLFSTLFSIVKPCPSHPQTRLTRYPFIVQYLPNTSFGMLERSDP